jgi:hypothetical protein
LFYYIYACEILRSPSEIKACVSLCDTKSLFSPWRYSAIVITTENIKERLMMKNKFFFKPLITAHKSVKSMYNYSNILNNKNKWLVTEHWPTEVHSCANTFMNDCVVWFRLLMIYIQYFIIISNNIEFDLVFLFSSQRHMYNWLINWLVFYASLSSISAISWCGSCMECICYWFCEVFISL